MKRIVFFVLVFTIVLVFTGCGSTAEIVIHGNQSVGDSWQCTSISPDGIVREVSNKYKILFPAPGMSGRFIIKFEAISEGEAEIVLTYYFRGTPVSTATYNASVNKRRRLTLVEVKTEAIENNETRNLLLGTWYDPVSRMAMRFLENEVQLSLHVDDIQTAFFLGYGEYKINNDNLTIFLTSEDGDVVLFTEEYSFEVTETSLKLISEDGLEYYIRQ